MNIPIIGAALQADEFRIWPEVTDERHAVRQSARNAIAAVLQVVAGLENTNQMDDAETAMSPGFESVDDYMTRDHRRRFQRVRVKLMGEAAIAVVLLRTCHTCGCTDDRACQGGCSWIADNCCSRCVTGRVM